MQGFKLQNINFGIYENNTELIIMGAPGSPFKRFNGKGFSIMRFFKINRFITSAFFLIEHIYPYFILIVKVELLKKC